MSGLPPIPYRWDGEAMRPLPRFARAVGGELAIDDVVMLEQVAERSEVAHKHEFAWLREAWLSLPENLAEEYPSVEHLRKRALIRTGYCTVTDYVCGSRAEAVRWAANLKKEADEYAMVVVSEAVVRVFRAKSQSRRAMRKDEFTASKQAILDWVSTLIGVEPSELGRAA